MLNAITLLCGCLLYSMTGACNTRVSIDSSTNVTAADASLCPNGTLSATGQLKWGSVALNNTARIEGDGGGVTITAESLLFNQPSVVLWRVNVIDTSLMFEKHVATNIVLSDGGLRGSIIYCRSGRFRIAAQNSIGIDTNITSQRSNNNGPAIEPLQSLNVLLMQSTMSNFNMGSTLHHEVLTLDMVASSMSRSNWQLYPSTASDIRIFSSNITSSAIFTACRGSSCKLDISGSVLLSSNFTTNSTAQCGSTLRDTIISNHFIGSRFSIVGVVRDAYFNTSSNVFTGGSNNTYGIDVKASSPLSCVPTTITLVSQNDTFINVLGVFIGGITNINLTINNLKGYESQTSVNVADTETSSFIFANCSECAVRIDGLRISNFVLGAILTVLPWYGTSAVVVTNANVENVTLAFGGMVLQSTNGTISGDISFVVANSSFINIDGVAEGILIFDGGWCREGNLSITQVEFRKIGCWQTHCLNYNVRCILARMCPSCDITLTDTSIVRHSGTALDIDTSHYTNPGRKLLLANATFVDVRQAVRLVASGPRVHIFVERSNFIDCKIAWETTGLQGQHCSWCRYSWKECTFVGTPQDAVMMNFGIDSDVSMANISITLPECGRSAFMNASSLDCTGCTVQQVGMAFNLALCKVLFFVLLNVTFSNANVNGVSGGVVKATNLSDFHGIYTNCQIKSNGGMFDVSGEVLLNGTVLSYGYASINGGCINAGSLSVWNSSISNCRSEKGGGAASVSSRAWIVSSTLSNCEAVVGGGVWISGLRASLVVVNSTFEGNAGGGASNIGGDCTIINSSFLGNNNYEAGFGGALQCKSIAVNDSRFVSNFADIQGGAIYSENLICSSSAFLVNFGRSEGGAIKARYIELISNSTFDNNTSFMAGALSCIDCNLRDVAFSFNNGQLGGAVYASGQLNIRDCIFTGNEAEESGGAVYAFTLNCVSSKFINNKSDRGGAIKAVTVLKMRDSVLKFNRAQLGGAVGCNGTFTAGNVTFLNNSAQSGGAIHIKSDLIMYDCVLESNSAVMGGAVVCEGVLNASRTIFHKNDGRIGGAAYAFKDVNLIEGVRFTSNTAVEGGGVYCAQNEYRSSVVIGSSAMPSVFSNNKAGRGAVLFATTGVLSVVCQGAVFSRNAAGDGIIFCSAQVKLSMCKFVENTAADRWAGIVVGRIFNSSNTSWIGNVLGWKGYAMGAVTGSNSITHNTFDGNTFSVFESVSGNMTVSDCVFKDNIANSALLRCLWSDCLIERVEFFRNKITENQTIYAEFNSTITLRWVKAYMDSRILVSETGQTTVSHILCERCHGCLAIRSPFQQARIVLTNITSDSSVPALDLRGIRTTVFVVEKSRFAGSAVYCEEADLVLIGVSASKAININSQPAIRDVYAKGMTAGAGSAVFFNGSEENSLHIQDSSFTNYSGDVYGTVCIEGFGSVYILNTTFTSNNATFGGALAVYSNESLSKNYTKRSFTIEGGVIQGNTAKFGGGVYMNVDTDYVSVSINTVFLNNVALEYGNDIATKATRVVANVVAGDRVDEIARVNDTDFSGEDSQIYEIPAGKEFVIFLQLKNAKGESVKLSRNFKVDLLTNQSELDTARAQVIPSLSESYFDTRGKAMFPLRVTGNIGNLVTFFVNVSLVPITPIQVELSGCPLAYGVTTILAIADGKPRGVSCMMCSDAEYSFGGVTQCYPCDEHMECEYNITKGTPLSRKGYWLTRPNKFGQVRAVKCPIADMCVGNSQCREGSDPSSPVCGRCEQGKYHWNGKCVVCHNDYKLIIAAFGLVLVALNIYAVFVQQTALPSADASLKILMQYSQVALLVMPELPAAQSLGIPVQVLSGNPGQSTTILPCFMTVSPAVFFHGSGVFSIASLLIVLLHRWGLAWWRRRRNAVHRSDITANSLISLLFMCVTGTTSALLDMLTCVDGGDVEVVLQAPSIRCSSREHNMNLIFLAGYAILSWGALLGMLCKIVFDYKDSPEKTVALWTFLFYHFENTHPSREMFDSRWEYYRAQLRAQLCRWWQCVILTRRVIILVVYVMGKRQIVNTNQCVGIILVLFLYLNVVVNPYKSWMDDAIDGLGSVLLMIATLLPNTRAGGLTVIMGGWSVLGVYLIKGLISKALARFGRKLKESSNSRMLISDDGSRSGDSSESSFTTREIEDSYDIYSSTGSMPAQ